MAESEGQSSKKPKKNFVWTAKAEKVLISFLAECAKNGEKSGKSFPKPVYTKAAKVVTESIEHLCTADNVEARLKTVKKKYAKIKALREKSGLGWDNEMKIIKAPRDVALELIENDPSAKEFINSPIEQYEELRLVCGEDQATGSFTKSLSGAPPQIDDGNEASSEISEDRRRGKRSRPWEDVMSTVQSLSQQVVKLSEALVDESFVEKLYAEVTNMEGFEMTFLEKAFDYLVANQLEGKKFLVRRMEMRKEWLQTFASTLD